MSLPRAWTRTPGAFAIRRNAIITHNTSRAGTKFFCLVGGWIIERRGNFPSLWDSRPALIVANLFPDTQTTAVLLNHKLAAGLSAGEQIGRDGIAHEFFNRIPHGTRAELRMKTAPHQEWQH